MTVLPERRHQAVVIGHRGPGRQLVVAFDDGTVHDTLPAGWSGDLLWLLDNIAPMFAGEGVLILPTEILGDQDAMRAAGWKWPPPVWPSHIGKPRGTTFGPWTTFERRRPGRQVDVVHVGILPWLGKDTLPLASVHDDPELIARRLGAFHRVVGLPYRATPGVVGSALLRRQYVGRARPKWRASNLPLGIKGIGDLIWSRELTYAERHAELVHQYDIRAQYPTAAGNALLAWDPLEHTGAVDFDRRRPGFWLAAFGRDPAWLLPMRPGIIETRKLLRDGSGWVTTPILTYLQDRGIEVPILDSWTAEEGHQLLRQWTYACRDARAAVTQHAQLQANRDALGDTIKMMGAETISHMVRESGAIRRADWAWAVRDTARANMMRKLDAAADVSGVTPYHVYHDSAYFTAPALGAELEAEAYAESIGLELGTHPGKFRHVKTWTLAEYEAEAEADRTRRRGPR